MEKIIQIATDVDNFYCLTADGKVYQRKLKDSEQVTEPASEKHPMGRTYTKGTHYWQEVPEEEHF